MKRNKAKKSLVDPEMYSLGVDLDMARYRVDELEEQLQSAIEREIYLERSLERITNCERCGGDWVDSGLQGDCYCTSINSLTAKLEAATAALEEIQLVSYQRYGGIVTVDIANAALKSIEEVKT